MNKKVIYIGVDVDDNAFHTTALFPETGEVLEYKCKPTFHGLLSRLAELKAKFQDFNVRVCYEASYLGFSLCRDLIAAGYDCQVVAPSSIPRVHGNQVKTDRIDAGKLAQFFATGILTFVSIPEKEMEADRDLTRTRQYILHQLAEIRTHVQSLLRRNGINFKSETENKSHWTKLHISWLDKKAESLNGSLKNNLKLLLQQMKWLMYTLAEYDKAIEELAQTERYKKQVSSLICYHGIKNIFAMVMITEIGNVNRFAHPNQLSSWIGFDVREYSSGGKHNRFGITKHGNRYLRTAFVEANQKLPRTKRIHDKLRYRRKDIDPALVHIADRCLERLAKKGSRLLYAGKHPNKVKVACAREMVGFVWESLKTVA
ncbi:MAG: IS110 family transposase [Flavobacterium sp.]|uniref:IS110 family transposase n=1 Tax=Flavobacterium sp. TaxID=239 RepID=UPI0025BC3CA9|nr:IS110 family transposase [Flavobacterium sp.]MCK6608999.1 IS110 family transposase [Flavobacterium sp.]